ncbi:MAG: tetratricopeptide repeat protein [Clostridia bacterium]
MIEKIFFNLLAFTLFIIVFFKMIKRNDTIYLSLIIMQAIGIAINFLELVIEVNFGLFVKCIMYLLSVFLPLFIIILEKRKINYSEIIYISLAKITLITGDEKKAKKYLLALIRKYPESYYGHKFLAQVYEKENQPSKAIDEYVRAIDINTKDYNSYYKIAELLDGLQRKEEAAQMLENLLEKKPEFYEASILLGNIYYDQEKFKEAANICLSALKYNSLDYDLYYLLGMAYSRLNDFQSAKEAYEKAANINTLEYSPYYNLAQIALICNDIDEAERFFAKSIECKETEGRAYYYLAKIALLKKDRENAINYMNLALEIEPELLKKLREDDLFIPILNYLKFPKEIPKTEKEKLTAKGKRQQDCRKHLEETYELVGRLNHRQIVQEKRKENKVKENEMADREIEEN